MKIIRLSPISSKYHFLPLENRYAVISVIDLIKIAAVPAVKLVKGIPEDDSFFVLK